jgi:uncharacterized membrane protein YvbJ
MVYCPKCGTQNPETNLYCSHCGSPLNQTQTSPSGETRYERRMRRREERGYSRGYFGLFFGLLIIFVGLVLLLEFYYPNIFPYNFPWWGIFILVVGVFLLIRWLSWSKRKP